MLITAQVLDLYCVRTTEGKVVKILNADPKYKFILTCDENGTFGVFLVNTGLWVCFGDTRGKAIAKAEGIFYHHSRGRYLGPYLYSSTLMFYAYLNYIWRCAATADLFDGAIYIRGGVPSFPFKPEKE